MATSGKRQPASFEWAETYLKLALELAYFMHPNKDIAFYLVEDAWGKLAAALGQQETARIIYEPRGFLKDQTRSRPVRTKIWLSREHMLQWLLYYESQTWERATERGDGPSAPSEDDMILRFIKHLIQLTLRRSSFYVALGIGRVLYTYRTPQVRRLFEDLTKDEARYKDDAYLRKRKMVLMTEMRQRFAGLIASETTEEKEERFHTQPPTPRLIDWVHECLHRFTPWDTTCVVRGRFDPTGMTPGLHFSKKNPMDEDRMEINRVHTILHADCFARVVNGLGFDAPGQRLAIPQFLNATADPPAGDRFHPPPWEPEDIIRLRRIWQVQAHRRKKLPAYQLSVSVDGIEQRRFDPRRTPRIHLSIGAQAQLIEVRGRDEDGELTLATLIVCCDQIPVGGAFQDAIVLEGGQKVMIQLSPTWDTDGDVEGAEVEVGYAETQPLRTLRWLAQRAWFGFLQRTGPGTDGSPVRRPGHVWLSRVGAVVAVIIAAILLGWLQLRRLPLDLPPAPEMARPPAPEIEPVSPPPSPTPTPRLPDEPPLLMARATWNRDPASALRAIPIETLRGTAAVVDLSRRQTTLLVNLPISDQTGQMYPHYRVTLLASARRLWQQTIRAPNVSVTGRTHVLEVTLFPTQLPKRERYDLQVEGATSAGWRTLGQIRIQANG